MLLMPDLIALWLLLFVDTKKALLNHRGGNTVTAK